MEDWKPCLPHYEVSNFGRVRRTSPGRATYAGRLMRPISMANGYLKVAPTVDSKNRHCYIHDLVALVFIGAKPIGSSVNHIDGNKQNNCASNLEYVSHAQNMAHAARIGLMARGENHRGSKMTEARVRLLRQQRAQGMSFSKLAREHGLAIGTTYQIAVGKLWSHVR